MPKTVLVALRVEHANSGQNVAARDEGLHVRMRSMLEHLYLATRRRSNLAQHAPVLFQVLTSKCNVLETNDIQ